MIRERDVERHLVKGVKELGGEVRKVSWVNRRGAPDRVIFLRGTHWIELKAPGEKPRPEQLREHKRMGDQEAYVYVLDSLERVDEFLGTLQ